VELPDRIAQIVRSRCRFVDPAEPLDPDAALTALGVGSLEIVEIIVDIEDAYGIEVPLEMLTPEMFTSTSTMWAGLRHLIVESGEPAMVQP
jgi:acyl carrier protein